MSLAAGRGYVARSSWTWSRILLFAVLLLIAGLFLGVIVDGNAAPREFWFPVFVYLFPVLALLLRPRAPAVRVFTALFASLSVLFFEISSGPLYLPEVPSWADRIVEFLSQSLILIFPFTFVHFSLVFPAAGQWPVRRLRQALIFIYVPLGILLLLHAVAQAAGSRYEPLDSAYIVFPVGFLLGLGIFVRSYLYSLTPTEKSRLRVMLIGCLAGGLPIILANLAGSQQLAGLALLLLPLFPLSLALAVLKEDFGEPAPIVQKAFRISMVAAGGVTIFFLASLLLSLAFGLPDRRLMLFSFVASLAMIGPLARWSGSYVGSRFPALPRRRGHATPVLTAFRSITPNPYIAGNPVRTPEMFFGRTEDFTFIRSRLDGQQHGCIVLLCGERRAGKTSILYQILNGRLGPDLIPVFLDMQELVVQNDREFVKGLAGRLGRALERRAARALSPHPGHVENYLQLAEIFDRVFRGLGASRLLLLFDEYELIGEKVQDGRLSAEVGHYLNSMLERHPRLNMVFAGSRPLEADPVFSRLLGKSFYREISFLALTDAVDLICSPLEGRVSFENQAVSELLLLTHGHPFFTQLLCQQLVEILNAMRTTTVTHDLVAEAVTNVLDSPPPQLLYKWSGHNREEKLVLAGLATLLKRPGSYLPADRLIRLVLSLPAQHRKDLDPVGIRIILEHLRQSSTLDRDQDRYGFTMDLFRRYIKVEHTVWGVLGEKR